MSGHKEKNHECEEIKDSAGVIQETEPGVWKLCIEDYGDWEPINYCPYCGKKLVE